MPVMAVVMIGIDPHKASHTAVAINAAEQSLGQLRVRASAVQAEWLLGWAQPWPERAWAGECRRSRNSPARRNTADFIQAGCFFLLVGPGLVAAPMGVAGRCAGWRGLRCPARLGFQLGL